MAHSHSHDHAHENEREHSSSEVHEHKHPHSRFQLSRKNRLRSVIAISLCFFIAEISVGFYTKSIALVADAFHYVRFLMLLTRPS